MTSCVPIGVGIGKEFKLNLLKVFSTLYLYQYNDRSVNDDNDNNDGPLRSHVSGSVVLPDWL